MRWIALIALILSACGGDDSCPDGGKVVTHEYSEQCEVDGECHGWALRFYDDGALQFEGFCDRGYPCGRWLGYDRDGAHVDTFDEPPCSWE